MSDATQISWTDSTFNAWVGCQKVSPACDNCYAEADKNRWYGGENWGPRAPRRLTSTANWRKPRTWRASVLNMAVSNAVAQIGREGLVALSKGASTQRIDPLVAMVMACWPFGDGGEPVVQFDAAALIG